MVGLAAPQPEPAPPIGKPAIGKPAADKKKEQEKEHGKANKKTPQPPCRVHGRVVDLTGQPVQNVGIALCDSKKLQTVLALNRPAFRGDADGKVEFMFPAPKEGDTTRTTMLLTAPGRLAYSRSLYYPKDKDKPALDLGEIILARGVMLQGRVRGTDGRPIAGAKVTARDAMGRSLFARYGNTFPQLGYLLSHAISDDRGAFLLPGVHAAAMALSISTDGYETRELPAVSLRQPLDVTLRKTGFVAGKVVDDKGQPIAEARLRISYEAGTASSSKTTGKDGTFKISLRHRHRYRLYVYLSGDRSRMYKRTYSEILTAPKQDVVIQLERMTAAKPAVKGANAVFLRVTDAATGGVVEKFKAAVLWMNTERHVQERHIQSQFKQQAKEAKMPGELQLPGPKENQPQQGLVIVAAKGYAQLRLKDIAWSEEEPVKVDAKLIKESVLAGVVRDEKTGKPVAGAKVFAAPDDPDEQVLRMMYGNTSPDQSNAVTTDDKGAFRLGGLGKGRYKVHVAQRNRPAPKPVRVALADAEQRTDLSLTMPRGARLTGKILGTAPQSGWRVKMVPRQDLNQVRGPIFYSYSSYSQTAGRTASVAKDGTFEFESLARGTYDLRLLIPRGPRGGAPVEIFIDPLRIRAKDIRRDFDASEDRPAKIKGKLTLTQAPVPLERLVVVATDYNNSRRYYYPSTDSSLMGARSMLQRDGSFELLVNKGVHMLKVVDLATGVVMVKPEASVEVEPGQTVARNLELAAAAVRVSLKPQQAGGTIVASHLEVAVQHPKPKAMAMFFGSSSSNTGVGVDLSDGKREVSLFLPLLETKLLVRTNSQRLQKTRRGAAPTLADHEFTPVAGKTNKVELLVAPPPEITEPEAVEGEDDEAAVKAKLNAVRAVAGGVVVLKKEKDEDKDKKAEDAEKTEKKENEKEKGAEKKAPAKKEPAKQKGR
jgi:protocatechuate 3,4-dioxygenase beta subunit